MEGRVAGENASEESTESNRVVARLVAIGTSDTGEETEIATTASTTSTASLLAESTKKEYDEGTSRCFEEESRVTCQIRERSSNGREIGTTVARDRPRIQRGTQRETETSVVKIESSSGGSNDDGPN